MKISELIRQLEETREWLGEDVDVFVAEPNTRLHGHFEVVGNKGMNEFDTPSAVIQPYIVKGSSK